jgi:anti-sigma B factor antagonist
MQVLLDSPQSGITTMRLVGDLDMNEVPHFRTALEEAIRTASRGIIVIMEDVGFIDSSGIAVLIEGLKWSQKRALPYILAHLTSGVQMVFELARLENFFTLAETVDDAVALMPSAS